LIWKFCEAHRESLVDKAKALQAEACEIVRQCFQTNEYRAFWEGTNVFTRHFRDAYKFQDPSYALPQPPIVDIQQRQPAGILGHQKNGPVLNMEVRSQGSQQQWGLLSTGDPYQMLDGAAMTEFGTASNAVCQGSGFMPEYRSNHGVATSEDQGSAQRHHSGVQDAQYGCQSFAGMNGAERSFNQDASYSGAYGDGQVQAIGTCEMGDQSWFDWNLFMRPLSNPPIS